MKFIFRPVLTIAALVALVILLSLGFWQMKRLQWKLQLIEQVESRISGEPIPFADAVARQKSGDDMEYASVVIHGAFVDAPPARLFGMLEGEPGYYLFQAFSPSSDWGFAPQAIAVADATAMPNTPLVIMGLFRSPERLSPPASWFRAVEKTPDGFWFVRDPTAFAASEGLSASAYYIDSFAVDVAEWPKGGTTRLDFSNRHLEYALTWFGLAGPLVGVFLFFSVQRHAQKT